MSASQINKKIPYPDNPKIIRQLGPPKNKSQASARIYFWSYMTIKNELILN